jgi:hypothetical protein
MSRLRPDRLTLVAGAAAVALLAAFAVLLAVTQHQSLADQRQRLDDRAATVASVTVALFDTAQQTTQEQANGRLGAKRVSSRALDGLAAANRWIYAEVLDDSGRLLAAGRGAPTGRATAQPRYVRAARDGSFAWSDVYGPESSTDQAVEWAVPYSVTVGRRVLVIGVRVSQISDVVTGILSRFKQLSEGDAAVIDTRGIVLASPTPGVVTGRRYPDAGLLRGVAHARAGDYRGAGGDRRFSSAPLQGTPWRVVVSTTDEVLYADVSGARAAIPWLILALLALSAVAGVLLLRRATRATADIARREANRRYALEINDNVIQRLTVAKLAMETGQSEVTHEKLTDTLREAQALVDQLLGDDVRSGDLRRRDRTPIS